MELPVRDMLHAQLIIHLHAWNMMQATSTKVYISNEVQTNKLSHAIWRLTCHALLRVS